MSTLTLIQEYAGLAIGLVFLLAAVSVLPGRVKWYVLTAGLAVIGYEGYMRMRNRKLLQKADAEREVLRARVSKMNEQGATLEKTVTELNQRLEELKARQFELDKKSQELESQGGELAAEKARLEQESKKVIAESDELLEKLDHGQSALSKLEEANHAFEQIIRMRQ